MKKEKSVKKVAPMKGKKPRGCGAAKKGCTPLTAY